jgi:hypothetical protein
MMNRRNFFGAAAGAAAAVSVPSDPVTKVGGGFSFPPHSAELSKYSPMEMERQNIESAIKRIQARQEEPVQIECPHDYVVAHIQAVKSYSPITKQRLIAENHNQRRVEENKRWNDLEIANLMKHLAGLK